jgi:RimJ/RimL family protein N-acetyltransferase
MSDDLNYRQATEGDCEAISGVVNAVVHQSDPTGLPGELSPDEVRRWLKRLGDQGALWVAEEGRNVVAFGALDFDTTELDTATLGVWVRPEYRRRGIATELAECLLEFAKGVGYRRIRGRLPEGNEPALSFLSAIGGLVPMRNPEMRFELPL